MTDSNPILCNSCKLPVPEFSPGGICPRCLLSEGIISDKTTGVSPTGTTAVPPFHTHYETPSFPSKEELAEWFPQLEVLELLGSGGMGIVYKARQNHLDRVVALKILSCPPESHEAFALRFEQEAKLLARLHHPNIVTLFDFGIVKKNNDDLPLYFFLMEYVEGSNLQEYITEKTIPPDQAFRITAQICEALQFAHDHGVLHRDIKPANLLLSSSDSIKLADFGIAKIISANREGKDTGITITGTSVGTPFYMAPEIWEEPETADHRADLYSLGAVLYHMLTGDRPSGRFERPSTISNLPRIVDAPIWKALAKNPDDRYGDARSFGKDAAKISNQLSGMHRPLRKRLILLTTIVLAGVALTIWNPLKNSPVQSAHEAASSANEEAKTPPTPSQGRVYLHFAGSEQKANLEPISSSLSEANFTLVYSRDIQSREKLPISTEVRYFREPKEKAGAEKVLSILKEIKGYEDARLLYVAGYGDVNRENHFEIWLGQSSFNHTKSPGTKLREQRRAEESGYLRIVNSSNVPGVDISKVDNLSDIIMVQSTRSHWYALRENGNLLSSNESHERLYVDSISGGPGRPIGIVETGGEIAILGSDTFFPSSKYPDSLIDRIAVACEVGSGHALALLENGEIYAWGPRYDREITAPEVATELTSARWPSPPSFGANTVAIAATKTNAAALQSNGEISIWGARGVIDSEDLETHYPIESIQSGEDGFLMLTKSGNAIHVIPPPPAKNASTRIVNIAPNVSIISSHFYYSDGKGWQSMSMPTDPTAPWKNSPRIKTGQICGYTMPSEDSLKNESVVIWVEAK